MARKLDDSKRQARIARILALMPTVREKLGAELPLPSDAAIAHAVAGMCKADGGMLRNAPSFRDKPLASIVHRLVCWHGSGGNLGGVFSVSFDVRYLPKTIDGPLVADIEPSRLYDVLDSLALVLRGGDSPAAEGWRRALGK